MTQEEKQLLLKGILPRQLYGVKAHYRYYDFVGGSERLIKEGDGVIKSVDISLGNPIYIDGHHVEVENIKPYLRPMSSMTEKEFELLKQYSGLEYDLLDLAEFPNNHKCLDFYLSEVPSYAVILVFDWLNAHHFDYCLLIERGLALEAPEGMYKIG